MITVNSTDLKKSPVMGKLRFLLSSRQATGKPQDGDRAFSCFNPFEKFHSLLNRWFYTFGRCVALYPSYFILVPCFLTILGLTGLQQIRQENDPETLFYPTNGPLPRERRVVETYFPVDYDSTFMPYHKTRLSGFARVLVKAKDGGSILRAHLWKEILQLDQLVRSVVVPYEEQSYPYEEMCAKRHGKCFYNKVMDLVHFIPAIENGSMVINYPLMLYPLVLPMFFGGIVVNESEAVMSDAKAISLYYFLKDGTHREHERAMIWEKLFLETLAGASFHSIHPSWFASRTIQDEMVNNLSAVEPHVGLTAVVMLLFSLSSVMMADWVRGKSILGVIGVLSAAMATVTAFGTLMYLGVPFSDINMIIPFLMIGIGIDDMFVVLASWRRTRLQDPLQERLAETFADAGVSITITSLTNMLSFSIGITTPIPSVQLFCVYTAFSVLLTYVWHLTFFGGCLAISGTLERRHIHSLFCLRVKSKSEAAADSKSWWYRFFCAGGINDDDPWNEMDNQPHALMVFFRDTVGGAITKSLAKGLVIGGFLVYISGAVYGCTVVQEGLDRHKFVRYDSYVADFYNMEDALFRLYPYSVQVVITGNVTYSDPATREKIMDLHRQFHELPYVANQIFTQSWLWTFYKYLQRKPDVMKNITDEESFVAEVGKFYPPNSTDVKVEDISYNEDFTRIVAARFILQTYDIRDTIADSKMMLGLREVAQRSDLNVTVFNPYFVLFDQFVQVRQITISAICSAAAVMIVVSLVFIPNPWCSLVVGFAIMSIEIGIIGYMSLWGVSLDPISMINLIMCIGFSVDFSAHITYSYLTTQKETSEERVKECMYCLGMPIVQSGLSTIVCIITFIFAPSYVYLTFFKIVFLVIFFGLLHGILLIPVLLSMFGGKTIHSLSKNIPSNALCQVTVLTHLGQEVDSSAPIPNHEYDSGSITSVEKAVLRKLSEGKDFDDTSSNTHSDSARGSLAGAANDGYLDDEENNVVPPSTDDSLIVLELPLEETLKS